MKPGPAAAGTAGNTGAFWCAELLPEHAGEPVPCGPCPPVLGARWTCVVVWLGAKLLV